MNWTVVVILKQQFFGKFDPFKELAFNVVAIEDHFHNKFKKLFREFISRNFEFYISPQVYIS